MKDKKDKKFKPKKESKSGLAKFTQRPLPDENEVSDFEKSVNKEIREDEIDDNLSEIYQDKKGNLVDVTSKSFKRNKSWILLILKNLLFLLVLAAGAYLAYYYYTNQYLSVTEAKLEIEAPEKIMAGEKFDYAIVYHNPSSVNLENIGLELKLPEGFVLLESSIEPELANYWDLKDLLPKQTKELKLSGKIYNRVNSANPINAQISYMPANFSSQFSSEASANTIVDDIGFDFSVNYFDTALVGQEAEVDLSFSDFSDNHLSDLIIEFNFPENIILENFTLNEDEDEDESEISFEKLSEDTWSLTNLTKNSDDLQFNLSFVVEEKVDDEERILISLSHQDEKGNQRKIEEESLQLEIMQSELDLSLEINENRNDQSINFGDKLDYVLSYHNRGQATLNEVVLMVVIEGEMVDWSLLDDLSQGRVLDSVIVYSANEIEDLEELSPDDKGEIEFSLEVKDYEEQDFGSDLKINSWAQFSFGLDTEDIERSEDNRSNTIEKVINSDLSLKEEIRYFDDNNIPVGSGPLPPEVDEETSVRVYWTLTNSLHELKDVEVKLELPPHVDFNQSLESDIGQLNYNETNNQVIWEIDNLALSSSRADAEFNLSFTPSQEDRDKILIISPGVNVSAHDVVTDGEINFKTSPKTSRLEDDEIAAWTNNGRVQ